ncbi:hypothetical protein ABGB18_19285 [Nonomuraea sp. B12E4]|uniref:hypothetical protein n=1 Tax=Nonomuraea sp. B12E4 TaxID=3153564 RepID=UPI00325C5AB0
MLDGRSLLAVDGGDRDGGEQALQRGLLDLQLAERGQHGRDVAEEGPVGTEDQHAAAFQPGAVRVQQVGGAVQADRRLAGAGRALHTQGDLQAGAYEVVLLGLDGGHDVAHGADAGALDLGGQQPAPTLLALLQPLVLEPGQRGARPAEAAAHRDALGVAGAGPVERTRDGRAPVDHHGWSAVLAADVPPADVVRAAVMLGPALLGPAGARPAEVQAAEERRPVRLLAELLGQALEVAAEAFCAVAVARHGLPDDHVVPRAFEHPAQAGPAALDVPALVLERVHDIP